MMTSDESLEEQVLLLFDNLGYTYIGLGYAEKT